ncbi:MAG TPA: glycosyltransferase 87 family protein [Gordonia sp. (in: high G+C Gram-positive bacteria)]|uniref:glycosyltransferase 87 family protein n=1 Tax=unclassified Gordonia (in: high G+C Gram-positive bacteria) TaxID=2657482 RepID=UPI000FB371A1|nr:MULTISPECIES: glycosyltransferase 87 family protein [unclassified Gordonia (in: high G+C Gram-positive bacteria)]RUP37397.1 MAG: DUF2029 domain-containing protein [Gordonia sp. (in: high G+C Gram-positive bacteria)]HNP57593.1 glycosyltransferase 87 family protein [Gordonia sp. (in: high G+C Gram-positive bacteria)]HRC50223.1 glycosyltransferase 87 family protein [Gordonia sp. (in: high G+C Gram-positive bacteria)]
MRRWAPSLHDPLVAPAAGRIGGPLGAHAAVGRARFSALRVLFVLALLALAVGWSGKTACLQETPDKAGSSAAVSSTRVSSSHPSADDGKHLNWANQREWYSLCFTRIPPTYTRKHLGDGVPFWTSWSETVDGKTVVRRMDDPVGSSMVAYAAARATAGWQELHERWGIPSAISPVVFFNVMAVVLALCWLVTIWALVKLAGDRRWFVWVAALSPVVFVHAFTTFDLLTVALVMTGLLAWDRRRSWLAGVLLGLSVTTASWPLLVIFAILIDAVVGARRGRLDPDGGRVNPEFARDLYRDPTPRDTIPRLMVAAMVTWLVVNVPVMIGAPDGWVQYWRTWSARGPEPDSIYGAIASLTKLNVNVTVVNVVSLVLSTAIVVAVVVTVSRAPRRMNVYAIAFLLISAVLMVAKVWPPQSALWLIPLAVLSVRSSRVLMAWMVVEALAWVPRAGVYLAPEHHWLPPQVYSLAVVVRLIALAGVCLHIVWEHYDPVDDAAAPALDDSPNASGHSPATVT